MKNSLPLFGVVMMAIFLLSCNEGIKDGAIKPTLSIEALDLIQNFESTATIKDITVTSNSPFSAVSSRPEWCTVTTSGHQEKNNLSIKLLANNEPKERVAKISVSLEGVSPIEIIITQIGTDPIILLRESASGIQLQGDNVDLSIELTTNIDVEFITPSWINQNPSKAIITKEYGFVANEMEQTEQTISREGSIIAKAKNPELFVAPVSVVVKQTKVGLDGLPQFAIISDLHFDRVSLDNQSAVVREQKLLTSLFAKNPNLDAIFICGDYADSGSESQYSSFFSVFDNPIYRPKTTPVYAVMGNHEWYTANADQRFNIKFGTKSTNNYYEIKDYPFITISTDTAYSPWYKSATRQFLEDNLAKAASKFPNKPIFVFAHVPVYGTTAGSTAYGSNELTSYLKKYPQVVFFTGHTHHSISDPRSIYQADFTSINAGSAWYLALDGGMVGGVELPGHDRILEALTARVQLNGDIVVNRWDLFRNQEILPQWDVKAPHDGSAFTYKNCTGEIPSFEASIKPIISKITENGCKITWDRATTVTQNSVVYKYLVEGVRKSNNTVQASLNICSMFFYNSDIPQTIDCTMSGLTLKEKYFVRITALDAFGNRSATSIQSDSFVIKEYEPDPSVRVPVADLMDVYFTSTTAQDRSPLAHIVQDGTKTPSLSFSSLTNSYIATCNAAQTTNYKIWYKDIEKIKTALVKDFSIECYYKTTASGTKCPFSALQQGGIGIENLTTTPTIQAFLGGTYKSLSAGQSVNMTDFYHIIFTYSGTTKMMTCYVNGVPSGEVIHVGAGVLTLPTNPQAQWFGIGADANVFPTVDYPFDGQIALCRLYSKVISPDEAYLINRQIKARKGITNLATLTDLLCSTIPTKIETVSQSGKDALNKVLKDGWALMGDFSTTQIQFTNFITTANTALANAN